MRAKVELTPVSLAQSLPHTHAHKSIQTNSVYISIVIEKFPKSFSCLSPLDGETCVCTSDVLHSKRVKRGEKKGMRESVREKKGEIEKEREKEEIKRKARDRKSLR